MFTSVKEVRTWGLQLWARAHNGEHIMAQVGIIDEGNTGRPADSAELAYISYQDGTLAEYTYCKPIFDAPAKSRDQMLEDFIQEYLPSEFFYSNEQHVPNMTAEELLERAKEGYAEYIPGLPGVL